MAATFPTNAVDGDVYDWQGISYKYDSSDDTWRRVHASYYVAYHDHDGQYYTEQEIDNILASLNTQLTTGQLDSRYYTETEVNNLLAGKLNTTHDMSLTLSGDVSGTATFTNMGNATLSVVIANDSHTHDGRYYTETEMNTLLAGKQNTGNYMVTSAANTSGNLTVNGWVRATGDVFAYYSDARLKDNIIAIPDALSKVQAIHGVTFKWNSAGKDLGLDDDELNVGLLAQEVKVVLPEAVKVMPGDNPEEYMTVKYEKLVPLLIEAIKEQQEQITALQQRIDRLEE